MTESIRFAPSPTGYLHKGHAYSALFSYYKALSLNGKFYLRIEDIDHTRCREIYTHAIFEDMAWLGIEYDKDVIYQSKRHLHYQSALNQLQAEKLLYPCFCTRSQLNMAQLNETQLNVDVYAGTCRPHPNKSAQLKEMMDNGRPYALRLNIAEAIKRIAHPLRFYEDGEGWIDGDIQDFGDVVLARKDIQTSYHLSVVVDDAAQGITCVTRGEDLKKASILHRLLQILLKLPEPRYHHHKLLIDHDGDKLAKSRASESLRSLREKGIEITQLQLPQISF